MVAGVDSESPSFDSIPPNQQKLLGYIELLDRPRAKELVYLAYLLKDSPEVGLSGIAWFTNGGIFSADIESLIAVLFGTGLIEFDSKSEKYALRGTIAAALACSGLVGKLRSYLETLSIVDSTGKVPVPSLYKAVYDRLSTSSERPMQKG